MTYFLIGHFLYHIIESTAQPMSQENELQYKFRKIYSRFQKIIAVDNIIDITENFLKFKYSYQSIINKCLLKKRLKIIGKNVNYLNNLKNFKNLKALINASSPGQVEIRSS